jgi:drug/metabolite transporter (DMT)-like permease
MASSPLAAVVTDGDLQQKIQALQYLGNRELMERDIPGALNALVIGLGDKTDKVVVQAVAALPFLPFAIRNPPARHDLRLLVVWALNGAIAAPMLWFFALPRTTATEAASASEAPMTTRPVRQPSARSSGTAQNAPWS